MSAVTVPVDAALSLAPETGHNPDEIQIFRQNSLKLVKHSYV